MTNQQKSKSPLQKNKLNMEIYKSSMNNFLNRRKKSLMLSKQNKRILISRKKPSLWKDNSMHYKQKHNKNKCNLTPNSKTGTKKFVQKLK